MVRSFLQKAFTPMGRMLRSAVKRPFTRRRIIALIAAVAVFVAFLWSVWQLWLLPAAAHSLFRRAAALYDPTANTPVQEEAYPAGMQEGFRKLYDMNTDVRGFLSYHAIEGADFLDIEYPVVFSDSGKNYASAAFNGGYNPVGTPYFDPRLYLTPEVHNNKSLIIYGNSTCDGTLAGLCKLVGNVAYARAATAFTLNTLYENGQYQLLAVMLTDDNENKLWYFDGAEVTFATNADFAAYVREIRARSLYDYPTEVKNGDRLAVLSTAVPRSVAGFSGGRLTVVARQVRYGETGGVNTVAITKNADVIMPRAWYIAKNTEFHPYYTDKDYVLTDE